MTQNEMRGDADGPLRGRVAVVTGASRGAGRGIAVELGAAGATGSGPAGAASGAGSTAAAGAPPVFSSYEKFVVATLAFLQFTIIIDFMILSPLGKFNLAHDSPLNEFTDRPLVSTDLLGVALSEPGFGALGQFGFARTGRHARERRAGHVHVQHPHRRRVRDGRQVGEGRRQQALETHKNNMQVGRSFGNSRSKRSGTAAGWNMRWIMPGRTARMQRNVP